MVNILFLNLFFKQMADSGSIQGAWSDQILRDPKLLISTFSRSTFKSSSHKFHEMALLSISSRSSSNLLLTRPRSSYLENQYILSPALKDLNNKILGRPST